MGRLIAFPAGRKPRTKAAAAPVVPLEAPVPELAQGPISCRDWCTIGDGHHDETYLDEQVCRTVPYRLDTTNLGGHPGHTRAVNTLDSSGTVGNHDHGEVGCPPVGGNATIVLQYQQAPGDQPCIILGIELAGVEQWATLTLPEARALAGNLEFAITDARS